MAERLGDGLAAEGDVTDAIVLSVSRKEASVRIKRYTGTMPNKEIAWTRTDDLTKLFQRGDIIQVKVKSVDEAAKTFEAVLDQEPLLEGAFLAIDPRSGQIKAMVGGYSFQRSEWNRATQATRQAGSAIKPLLYTAALENRFTASTPIEDVPVTFADKWLGQDWSPKNYDLKYQGDGDPAHGRRGITQCRDRQDAGFHFPPDRGRLLPEIRPDLDDLSLSVAGPRNVRGQPDRAGLGLLGLTRTRASASLPISSPGSKTGRAGSSRRPRSRRRR